MEFLVKITQQPPQIYGTEATDISIYCTFEEVDEEGCCIGQRGYFVCDGNKLITQFPSWFEGSHSGHFRNQLKKQGYSFGREPLTEDERDKIRYFREDLSYDLYYSMNVRYVEVYLDWYDNNKVWLRVEYQYSKQLAPNAYHGKVVLDRKTLEVIEDLDVSQDKLWMDNLKYRWRRLTYRLQKRFGQY